MRKSHGNKRSKKPSAVNRPDRTLSGAKHSARRLAVALCFLLTLCLLFAGPALASYELVGSFGEGSTPPVNESSGIAVNETGAGGVPVGTVYEVNKTQPRTHEFGVSVLSYTPQGVFRQAWGWGVADNKAEFERCGPEGEAAHATCLVEAVDRRSEGLGEIEEPEGVAVDQATGDVYVFNRGREKGAVQVFAASGEPVGGFGENYLKFGEEPIAASPEKFHETFKHGRISVDDSGNVYIADFQNRNSGSESRVMVFKPKSPGDYGHYEYAGQGDDIGFSANPSYTNGLIATDDAGDVYVANTEFVSEFSPGETVSPICRYKLPGAQLSGMTVNRRTGEVFVISYSDFEFRQLAPCDAQGQFVEKTSFPAGSTYPDAFALALDAALPYSSSRPDGIFYFASPPTSRTWNIRVYAPAEVRPPRIEAESVSSDGATSAVFHARVDPEGSQTSYTFQFLPEATYEANEPANRFAGALEAPIGGAAIGSGHEVLSATASVAGLQPDTAYRFRVVASSPCNPEEEEVLCTASGVAERFRTYPLESSTLPDHRAYELVSPIDKNGGQVFQLEPSTGCNECNQPADEIFPKQASLDGEAVVFEGTPFSTSGGAIRDNEYLARRTPAGWQTSNLTPERLATGSSETGFRAFDPSLAEGLIAAATPSLVPSAPSEYPNLYSFPSDDPAQLSPLLGQEPPNRSPGSGETGLRIIYAGASTNLSHVLLEANASYTPETAFAPEAVDGGPKSDNLYEVVEGELRLVNVLPGNKTTAPAATFGAGGLYYPSPEQREHEYAFDHAISDDGARIFWSDASGQVYVRENGEITREIPDHAGKYLTAAADGSKVLLSDGLVYDLESDSSTDLTEGLGGFEGLVGQSADLSSIYFVDKAVLGGSAENEHGERPLHGAANLYVYHEGASSYVATLDANDGKLGPNVDKVGDWNQAAGYRTAEASSNGRYLAFTSLAELTGDGSESQACFAVEGVHSCEEIFLYDSQTARLVCASCNRTDRPPLGGSALPVNDPQNATFRSPQHYLTDSGRLYFDSKDSLSPFDVNEGFEDVYQYEPMGLGTCERPDGCVKLISAGSEPTDSTFLDADESGANVFFTTRDRLAPKDVDELVDLYDARENGGISSEAEGASGECQADTCQPAPTVPITVPPASLSFTGLGNITPLLLTTKPTVKKETNAERLTAALKACKRKASRRKRLSCEKVAREHYGPKRTTKSKHAAKRGAR
jgi:hypothetical protein